MDEVGLALVLFPDDGEEPSTQAVDVRINGRRLCELLAASTGQEVSPVAAFHVFGPEPPLWLGGDLPVEFDDVPTGSRAVVTCTCGEWGCGGVSASIVLTECEVIWTHFEQSNGTPVDLPDFRFDRTGYEEALRTARHEWQQKGRS
jgi:hypothetical protein